MHKIIETIAIILYIWYSKGGGTYKKLENYDFKDNHHKSKTRFFFI